MSPTRYLVAIDGEDGTDHVVDVAANLASALGGGAELHFVHVVTESTVGVPPTLVSSEAVAEAGREKLDRALEMAGEHFAGPIVGHLVPGKAAEGILALAEEMSPELLVVGTTDKKAFQRILLGSVAGRVVRYAKCPVLVARKKSYSEAAPEDRAPFARSRGAGALGKNTTA